MKILPAGRILNRFSKDIGSMDEQLPPVGILNLSQSDLVCYFQAIFDVLTVGRIKKNIVKGLVFSQNR